MQEVLSEWNILKFHIVQLVKNVKDLKNLGIWEKDI